MTALASVLTGAHTRDEIAYNRPRFHFLSMPYQQPGLITAVFDALCHVIQERHCGSHKYISQNRAGTFQPHISEHTWCVESEVAAPRMGLVKASRA